MVVEHNYGFIVCPQSSEDVIFHSRDIVSGDSCEQNQVVSFVARLSQQGRMQASQVTIMGKGDEEEFESRQN